MQLANGTTVDAASAMTIVPTIYDSAGYLALGILAVTLYLLEDLPSSCVLGMPFLSACNPAIDWARRTVSFTSLVILCLPQQSIAAIELGSLHTLHETLHKAMGYTWCYLLQSAAFYLSMGDSSSLVVVQEGFITLTILGMDHPMVAPFLKEFADVFSDPVFPPGIYITRDIDLIDPMW